MGLQVLYLSRKDIEEVSLSMAEIINVVEKAFGFVCGGRGVKF